MSAVIKVENLGKSYLVGHQSGNRERYVAMRDVIARGVKDVLRKTGDAFKGRQIVQGDEVEEFWALRDVSFEVRQGEVVGIIGRNGAGKSTLLKVLSRITEPSVGRVTIRGRVASLLEVGTGFHPELSGRENVFLNGAILGMTKQEIRNKFDEIVAFAEVEKFLDTPVKRYSSGMYVRLAFAVAAHLEPEILIVDEVLAVGDAAFQKKCLGKMREVSAGQGRTVIFVSHNMGSVRSLCSRVCALRGGRVYALGETNLIVEDYLRSSVLESRSSLQTGNLPRGGASGSSARITEVVLNDGKMVLAGEALKVQFRILAFQNVEDASVGIGFAMLDGTRLLTIESDLEGRRFNLKAGESISITANLAVLPLQPASYVVDLGIRSGDFHSVDYLGAVFSVDVLPGARTPGFLVNSASPGVRVPAQWIF